MSREAWNNIIQSKGFYIRSYRKGLTWVILSLGVNLILLLSIYYVHFNEPEPDYYATSGIAPPVKLTSLNERNYSSNYLLPPDPVDEDMTRVIPQ
ncbi:type IVB secretion system protein IcmM/DotJ [Legionella jordanis]|uniref:Component of the Dot/Icm secretion system, predicted inner membrane protein n=1 Tax=Legionella jordanis TaxID=456 RepID=A0A0W0VE39_9GAMM|nr:type IVB secretion system protein IcmM/DotJ [Legionella jordanis]KTD18368.1 Component of the Dot/Icm secretion system, predicted inner membrane protein [Legionella jordanis]RMX05278.1 phosphoesterase [Legionella jordanis]RMX20871.1 phosphoesterase [Legionella jordanis]VEH13286.1 Component of the Dot/Icm secretion system. inner membrane protein [Legionella jordanis]HAT8713634.1 phosphoesterase [Legionella jordanis]